MSATKKHGLLRPLLLLGPLIGIGAYIILNKARPAKAPEYDPDWPWQGSGPHPATAPSAMPTLDDIVAMTEPAGGNEELAVISKAGELLNKRVVDLNGDAVGEAEAVYYRSLSGEPEWIAITLGLAEPRRVLVPLDGASIEPDEIRVAQGKADIDAAPAVDAVVVDEEAEMVLFGHYGVRRVLPGVESERNDENLRLRMWQPASSTTEHDAPLAKPPEA